MRESLVVLVLYLLPASLPGQVSPLLPGSIRLPEFADTITWSENKAEKIRSFIDSQLTGALLIYDDDKLVFESGDLHKPFHIFSARKSLLSLLYGIYIDKGSIDPYKTLSELGINDKQGLTSGERNARVIDLLRSRSGVYHPASFETPGMQKNRPMREEFRQDEHWYYNNWDFNALTTIFEQSTGLSVFEAFRTSIAEPLGLTDYDTSLQRYHFEEVSLHPATLWYLSAYDLGKIGEVLLNKGLYEGTQIIPASWINESTQPYSNCGILGGYGYCWWSALNGLHYPFVNIPDGTFSARGTGEQNLVVIPKWQMVIVHLTEVTSPDDEMMHVTDFGRLLKIILEQSW